MRTIDDYLDAAKKATGTTSDRQLAAILDLKPTTTWSKVTISELKKFRLFGTGRTVNGLNLTD